VIIMKSKIKVLVVEPDLLVRKGLVSILNDTENLIVLILR